MSVEPDALQLAFRGGSFRGFVLVALAAVCPSFALLGCENTAQLESVGTGGSSGTATFEVIDGNNYSARDTLAIPEVETTSGADFAIDWSGFTVDLYQQAVSPAADVDSVVLLRFQDMDQATLTKKLAENQLGLSDIDVSFRLETDHVATTTTLSALLDANGAPINIEEAFISGVGYSYLLTLAGGTAPGTTTPGLGTRAMTFVRPSATAEITPVTVGPAIDVLGRVVTMGREPLSVPVTGPWTMDWSSLTRDSVGARVPFESIDGLVLAYYEGKTVEALEADYFNLGTTQTKKWELALKSVTSAPKTVLSASLGQAKEVLPDDTYGAVFSGFEGMTNGVWLMSLTCSTCMNPAPPVLVVLEPATAP